MKLQLTDSEAEQVLRAVHLQWEYWHLQASYGEVPDALAVQQELVWRQLHDKLQAQMEGEGDQ